MPKKKDKPQINMKALKRFLIGLGLISGGELLICAFLGVVPPEGRVQWMLVGICVGGPIVLTLVGTVSYFVLVRMGVDVPTDVARNDPDINYIASRAKYGDRDHE